MGRSARETGKTSAPIRFRLTDALLDEIDTAWKNSDLKHLNRQDFMLYLLENGLKRHKEKEDAYKEKTQSHAAGGHMMAAEKQQDYNAG